MTTLLIFAAFALTAYTAVQIIETHYRLKMHSRDVKRLKAIAEGDTENV